jgi:hypothetical protein
MKYIFVVLALAAIFLVIHGNPFREPFDAMSKNMRLQSYGSPYYWNYIDGNCNARHYEFYDKKYATLTAGNVIILE